MHGPCLLLISILFASSQADPDPADTHIHFHLPPEEDSKPGKSPNLTKTKTKTKTGAGVLTPRGSDYNSGQPKTGPTEPTLTTVSSIRSEMHNENSDYLQDHRLLVSCGGHRARLCAYCPNKAPNKKTRPNYCNGQCKWVFKSWPGNDGQCVSKKNSQAGSNSVNCGGHRAPSCGVCYGAVHPGHNNVNSPARSQCNGDCQWTCVAAVGLHVPPYHDCRAYDCRPKTSLQAKSFAVAIPTAKSFTSLSANPVPQPKPPQTGDYFNHQNSGVLNPRGGDYNSGQPKAGPTQPTLTTVSSIRNEMHSENSELSPDPRGVSCGGHRAIICAHCPDKAPNKQTRPNYCNGQCKWVFKSWPGNDGQCVDRNSQTGSNSVNCGGHRAPSCGVCYGAKSPHPDFNNFARSKCNGECHWTCVASVALHVPPYHQCRAYDCKSRIRVAKSFAVAKTGDYFNHQNTNLPADGAEIGFGSHPPPSGGWKVQDCRYNKWKKMPFCKCVSKCMTRKVAGQKRVCQVKCNVGQTVSKGGADYRLPFHQWQLPTSNQL